MNKKEYDKIYNAQPEIKAIRKIRARIHEVEKQLKKYDKPLEKYAL